MGELFQKGSIGAGGYPVFRTTQKDHILQHTILDEELDLLSIGQKERAQNIRTMTIGVACGAFPITVSSLWGYIFKGDALLGLELATIIMFSGAFCVAVVAHILKKDMTESPQQLAARIRARSYNEGR